MTELLIKAIDYVNPDPVEDRIGSYKRGMIIAVKEDNHTWGNKECLPKFVVLKIPGISVQNVLKFCESYDIDMGGGTMLTYRRRRWIIRWSDLPQVAKDKLKNNGELIIKVDNYSGDYDYTWNQIKNYFRNQETKLDGAELNG